MTRIVVIHDPARPMPPRVAARIRGLIEAGRTVDLHPVGSEIAGRRGTYLVVDELDLSAAALVVAAPERLLP